MKTALALVLALAMASIGSSQTYTIHTVAGGGLPVNEPASSAGLGPVSAVAIDASGNIFAALSVYNIVVRVDARTGYVSLVAGTGRFGYNGDNIAATTAQLAAPWGVAVDSAGNLYIADVVNHRVRKVTNGVITTVAGTGSQGYNGDNIAATTAQLNAPRGVAVDSAGNLYIADVFNHRVRKVSNGVITTVAGTGTQGYNGDNIPAASAHLNAPRGVAVDSADNLYIADLGNIRVRKVTNGVITTVAGNGGSGHSGDNIPATIAQLGCPTDVAADSAGNLYFTDYCDNRLRKVSNGVITTVAGTGTQGYNGDNIPAATAQLNAPWGVAVDSAGNLYIADAGNDRIRKVSNGVITTVVGNGTQGYNGDNIPANTAQLGGPIGVAVDSAGSLYIADANRVRKVSHGVITTVAGTGTPGYNGDNIPATTAQLNAPQGVAVDSAGNLYIADAGNNRVRKVSHGVITTVAGTGENGYDRDSIPATTAQLDGPTGVAVDSAGNLYIADGSYIREVSNGVITTVAGTGGWLYDGDDIPATTAQLSAPQGVAVDSAGNLYIADLLNHRIRKVSNGMITTVAGTGTPGCNGDNIPAATAQLSFPHGVAVDSAGNLYIADECHLIRKVSNGVITTVAGTGAPGYNGDNIPATTAQLNAPHGVAVDPAGDVYVADSGNLLVRVLVPSAAPGCTYSVSTSDLGVAAAGGTSTLQIHTGPSCSWTISGLPAWITVSGSSQGSGSADVMLVASSNPYGARAASVSTGGVSVPVRQFDSSACGGSSSCVTRALPHVAFGGEWTTGLFAVSTGAQTGSFAVSFLSDTGSSLSLPFTGGLGNLNVLTDSVSAQGRKDYEASNASLPVQGGWGLVTADASITTQATFRRATPNGNFYEAAAPATEGYSGFIIPFDSSTFPSTGAPLYTGFAISNLNPIAAAHVACTARDHSGAVIPNAPTIPTLNPSGHYANYLSPVLTGKRGTLDCAADTLVAAIALRFIGTEAFSTLPVIVK